MKLKQETEYKGKLIKVGDQAKKYSSLYVAAIIQWGTHDWILYGSGHNGKRNEYDSYSSYDSINDFTELNDMRVCTAETWLRKHVKR